MKRSGGALNAYYQVKEANLKRLYMLYDSNLHTFWKRQSYSDQERSMVARSSGRWGEE